MDFSFIIILALAFGAMWLMTNRTRKQQRQAADFRANLEVGQEVMTGSGLFGTVVDIDDDIITLESTPGNESRWLRAAIAKLVEPPVDEDDDEEYDEDEADDDESYGSEEESRDAIDVPDDLSSMPPARPSTDDDDTEKK